MLDMRADKVMLALVVMVMVMAVVMAAVVVAVVVGPASLGLDGKRAGVGCTGSDDVDGAVFGHVRSQVIHPRATQSTHLNRS